MSDQGTHTNLARALSKHLPQEAPETIDGQVVAETADDVMLDVAYSPVLAQIDTIQPSDVTALEGGRYRVYMDGRTTDVSADVLRVMRARYLLRRGEILRRWHDLDGETQSRATAVFFQGKLPWIAPRGSMLDKLNRGEVGNPISIPRDGDAPVDFAAIFTALATPGGEVPAVCPVVTDGTGLASGLYAVKATPPPEPTLPEGSMLDGPHDKRCCFWKVNDPSVLDVTRLPKGFAMCADHWQRVRTSQGGRLKQHKYTA